MSPWIPGISYLNLLLCTISSFSRGKLPLPPIAMAIFGIAAAAIGIWFSTMHDAIATVTKLNPVAISLTVFATGVILVVNSIWQIRLRGPRSQEPIS